MEANQAAEQLQTIRTLMERSALYRRALAPIMIFAGLSGIVGGAAGLRFKINSSRDFTMLWLGVAAIVLIGSFLLARRQALKDSEPFWSPPTKRVGEALFPPFLVTLILSCVLSWRFGESERDAPMVLVVLWAVLYGCALHSAGFFMPRAIKMIGWLFVLTGCAILCWLLTINSSVDCSPHLLMMTVFGGLHLASGIYLYFTEKRRNVS